MKSALCFMLLIASCFILSCGKDNGKEGDPSQKLNFQLLEVENDTINAGETTVIKATVTGYMLKYYWSATAGDLLGSGEKVTYSTSPCQVGSNQVSCKVIDGNDESETKTITIVVQ